MIIVKENGKKKVQSVTYAYTPCGEGEAGEIIHTTISRHRFQVIRLAEFDVTANVKLKTPPNAMARS